MSNRNAQNQQVQARNGKDHALQEFRESLKGKMRDEVAAQLPKGIDVDRFIRTAITAVQLAPELLTANRSSLYGALMQCAKDGLIPDGKEATIQIYNTNIGTRENPEWVKAASYMPMVGGLLRQMYEAGCTYVDAAAVYEEDHFVFKRGDSPSIEHEPDIIADNPGKVIAAYAIVKLGNGETKREVMPRRDIEKVREASKASKGPGWTNWYDQFAIKAVLKRIYKQLPHTNERLEKIIQHDNEAMGFESWNSSAPPRDLDAITGEGVKAIENQSQSRGGRPSRLDKILQDQKLDRRERVPAGEAEKPAHRDQQASEAEYQDQGGDYEPAD